MCEIHTSKDADQSLGIFFDSYFMHAQIGIGRREREREREKPKHISALAVGGASKPKPITAS